MRTPAAWMFIVAVGLGLGLAIALIQFGLSGSDELALSSPGQARQSVLPPLPPADGPQPLLVVEEGGTYDFGKMEAHSKGSHTFVVRNVGDFLLRLKLGETTCKCTMSGLSSDQILPGKTGQITLEWTAEAQFSNFRQSATIWTNDREHRRLDLVIVGKLIESVVIEPTSVDFSKPRDKVRTYEVEVIAAESDDLLIEGHSFSDPDIAEEFEVTYTRLPDDKVNPNKGRSGWKVTITVSSGLPVGKVEQKVILETNIAERPRVTLTMRGRIVGDITVSGRNWNEKTGVLNLGNVDGDRGAVFRANIIVRGPHQNDVSFRLLKVTPQFVNVQLGEPEKVGRIVRVPLVIEIPRGSGAANHLGSEQGEYGQIVLETGHPELERLELRLRFAVIAG